MPFLKRIYLLLLTFTILSCYVPAFGAGGREITLRNGDYVALGSYMGKPILWRCMGSDKNGMLLVSRDVLCYKSYAVDNGRWDKSFLRTWLNSADTSVDWNGPAPDLENTDGNAYADEPGFLSGFAPEELSLLKSVTLKSTLNVNDIQEADFGSEIHIYNSNGVFIRSIQNYDVAFGVYTDDYVFCLNMEQMEVIAINYPSEFIAQPAEGAAEQSGNIKNEENRSNNYYWLRDGIGNVEFPEAVRTVFPNGRVFFADANDSSIGVRPGIYLDKQIPVIDGNGYESTPYVVSENRISREIGKGSANKNRERLTVEGEFASITEGDYLIMGSLYGSDILWRCVDVNENGPLMLSERILGFKSVDAIGNHGNERRNNYGSNNWSMSNLRHWLNSDEPEGAKEWPCGNAPNSDSTGGANGYSNEQGFLNSFSPEELEHIKTVYLRTIIHPLDIDENTVGTEEMEMRRNINHLVNYDTAYSRYDYERIFLLSLAEAKAVKEDFGIDILAIPTPEAVARNEAGIDGLSADRVAAWWLRDADGRSPYSNCVRNITQDGWLDSESAAMPTLGVRPAFYLDVSTLRFVSGDGSSEDPYRVQAHDYGEWEITSAPSCISQGVRSRVCSVCGSVDEENIPASGHSFYVLGRRRDGIHVITQMVCKNCGETYSSRQIGIIPAIGAMGLAILIAALWLLQKRRR